MGNIDQLKVYHLADQLVTHEGFHLLLVNEQRAEIWLEKTERKITTVIRLIQEDLIWKNHINTDIENVFLQMKAMKKMLYGKKIFVHNVYFSSYPFTESLEIFHKPVVKADIDMTTYHINDYDEVEQRRFEQNIGIPPVTSISTPYEDLERSISYYKQKLKESTLNQRKEIEKLFTYGKPIFTYTLLLMNIIIFLFLELNGGSTNIENLIQFGAKYNIAILDGEWWRLFSSMFLHIGLLHLVMNMFALYYLGTAVERIFGSLRFIIIYLLAGLGGGLASFAFTINVSAGASGAIFGLFGALLFFGLNHKKIFFQTTGKNIIFIIALNVVFGLAVPQIDNSAHLGGLVMGFIASAIVHLPKKRQVTFQFSGLLLCAAMIAFLIFFGLQNPQNQTMQQISKIDELNREENFEEVVKLTSELISQPTQMEAELLFQRAYAYIALNQHDLAIKDLEESIQIRGDIPEAYYNLAILYFDKGENELAKDAISKAVEMNPNRDDFNRLYERITESAHTD